MLKVIQSASKYRSLLILSIVFAIPGSGATGISNLQVSDQLSVYAFLPDTTEVPLPPAPLASPQDYMFEEPPATPFLRSEPGNITTEILYDPDTGRYYKVRKMGDRIIGRPTYISFEDYLDYDMDRALRNYWAEKARPQAFERQDGLIPSIYVGGEVFDRIFGGSTIDIRPTGSAELIFGVLSNRRDDPRLDERRRQTTNFDFQQKIQLSVQAKIGEKIEIQSNYNTEASFDFENKMKLEYRGNEDEILQLIEAGDVTLPLPGTLISGNQGLFGFKTMLRFGNTTVTSVFSQQRTESKSIMVQGGAQTTEFEFKADDYEENRHFFLAHYHRDQYDFALENLPVIQSNVIINNIEVWITNIGAATDDNRNIVAFADLGESQPYLDFLAGSPIPYPANNANQIINYFGNPSVRSISQVNSYLSQEGFSSGRDFVNIENARRLRPNEYTYNARLGFISLNQAVSPDHVLAVAYEYSLIGDTTTYKVGEFSNELDAPNALIVKLLKSTSVNTSHPLWDLMMKNVYSMGAFQINREDFRLNILYEDQELGVPIGFLNEGPVEGMPLIRVMGLDRLNTQQDPYPDGVFDFIDQAATQGGTIQSSNGRIYFPVVEPFGSHLRKMLQDPALGDKYAFDSLYTTTKYRAQQFPEKNRFIMEGRYKSASGSEIPLNAINIPPGSVVVTAGGVQLTENQDYTVDYTLGRVRIINEAYLNSGAPIRISLESSSLFNIQTKTLMGTHIDHRVNENLNLGATIMRLSERPLTQKVNYGDEPIANTIWGMNATYQTESLFLTRMLDRMPFYSTTARSRISFTGEFANLIPGHSRLIGRSGTAYIDDFEGSKSSIDLKNIFNWHLASTPQHQPTLFPEAAPATGLAFRYNNARLAWYSIDRLFWDNNSLTPAHIRNDQDQQSNHYVREVRENEIWPNKDNPSGIPASIPVLNLAYYPAERGMYNFDPAGGSSFSRGIAMDGMLVDPNTRWGGIMRAMQNTDFENANIEYIEFWMLDPFIYDEDTNRGGDLYFNLGDISEDMLRDGRKSFENGLPTTGQVVNVDTTIWGRVPTIQAITNSFDNNPTAREFQDLGLNGLNSEDEYTFPSYQGFLNSIRNVYGESSLAYQQALEDPAADDFRYFRGSQLDQDRVSILDRYKRFNGLEGNSPTSAMSPEAYPTQATDLPNTEDINLDGTLNETERYWQYRVSLRPEDMVVGENYISDIMEARVTLRNGDIDVVKWYQFKIPLRDPNRQSVNGIQDFKSVRFMRVFLRDFEVPVVLRFATLELVRGNWRTFDRGLSADGEYVPVDNTDTAFEVFTVNIEENGTRSPVPYALPPGIEREQDLGTTSLQRRNEQSLAMRVSNLKDGDARAIYKTANLDMRQYRRIRMFAHAEAFGEEAALRDDDLTVFIRLGSDFTNNYYEYEVPMKLTPWGTGPIRELVWPSENDFDIHLEKLTAMKLSRNTLMRDASTGVSLNTPYVEFDGNNKMTVVGTPTLSNVKVIMMGVRNPRRTFATPGDDGLPKSAEIWVNELRLYEFEDQGGWAASGRMNAQLADLGNLTVAGFTSTPGFGSIEQKVSERSKEYVRSYDVASNLELGKFFPENSGIRVPFHFSFSESFIDPQYNPLNPDILFRDDLDSYDTEAQRDSIKSLAQDYVRRKNFNFTNVGKSRLTPGGRNRFYAIENFDVTYSYSEIFARNIDIEFDRQKHWRGGLGYNWQTSPNPVTPFAQTSLFSNNAFRIIRDFNFYYLPRLVSFRSNIDRRYGETLLRDKSSYQIVLEPNYVKTFSWDRLYDVRYDLTRALKLEFRATNNARIDEPPGRINRNDENWPETRDEILGNIRTFGRTTFYTHRANLTYNLPINKLPMLDWVTANAGYTADFDWQAAPLAAQQLGNTIENSNTKRINANANLVNLYNKVGFLRTINQKGQVRPQPQRPQQQRPQPQQQPQQQEEEGPNYVKVISEGFLRVLMGFRNISLSYTESNGTRLPGFNPTPSVLGQNWDFNQDGFGAPGLGFIFGSQEDIRYQAATQGWITTDPQFNNAYTTNLTQNLSGRSQFEPFPHMRIEFTALRNYARTQSEFFKVNEDLSFFDEFGNINRFSPQTNGSFSISFLSLRTSFEGTDDQHTSAAFENFKKYRIDLADRLADRNFNADPALVDSLGWPIGYGPTSQEVLISSFMAAYAGWDPKSSQTNPFLKIPMPNWRLTYDGLSRINALKKYFTTFTIGHGYRSTFTINSYRSVPSYRERNGSPSARDAQGNFIPEYEISQVSINEQFSPLISFDVTWVNSLMTRLEYRSSRNIGLSMANNQVTDLQTREIIVGTGYRFKDLAFNLAQGGNTQRIQSDLVTRLDLSFRNNKTVLRKIVEGVDVISAGQNSVGINFSADYQVSARVNMRLFYDRTIINPFVSNLFPTSNTHAGFSFRFMLM